MRYSKYVKRILKGIIFASIFIVLTIGLDAILEFDEGDTERMLVDYSGQQNLNMIFTGNSAGKFMKYNRYNELSAENGFNMCTPSQGLEVAYKNIYMATSQHPIKHIILFVTYDTFNNDNTEPIEHIYDRVIVADEGMLGQVRDTVRQDIKHSLEPDNIAKEDSINLWIPWTQETVTDLDSMKKNVKRRFGRFKRGDRLGHGIAHKLDSVVYNTRPFNPTDKDVELLAKDVEAAQNLDIPEGMLNTEKLSKLDKILVYCRDNNIKLSVIVTPHRTDYFDRYESYRGYSEILDDYLRDFVIRRGFKYYNSEEDPRLHDILPDSYFYDVEHVEEEYSITATEYITGIIMDKML